jgi:phosphoglycerate kinase
MKLKSIKELKNLKNKTVFLRVDFNVAMSGKKITEEYRIDRVLPSIRFLIKNDCRIVIGAHLGRPEGKLNSLFSLQPVFNLLKKKLAGQKMFFAKGNIENEKIRESIKKNKARIILLENLRFYKGEEKNDLKFAKKLADLAEIYVNDAFAVCHRQAASLVAITKYLPSFAGLNLLDEVKFLTSAINPAKPAVALVGGIKLDSKFGVIKNFLGKYSKILVGGGVAHLLLKSNDCAIGSSVTDQKFEKPARRLKNNAKIVLPVDFVIADAKSKKKVRYHKLIWGKEICEKDEMILDIGPQTIKLFEKLLNKAKTIVWAGPLGLTDNKKFARGSELIANFISQQKSITIAGGGETIAVINNLNLGNKFSFISTGGGAMLEFLEGKLLPGIKPLLK